MKSAKLKSQAPNFKHQIPNKHQLPKYKIKPFGLLEFVWDLEFGHWNLILWM